MTTAVRHRDGVTYPYEVVKSYGVTDILSLKSHGEAGASLMCYMWLAPQTYTRYCKARTLLVALDGLKGLPDLTPFGEVLIALAEEAGPYTTAVEVVNAAAALVQDGSK